MNIWQQQLYDDLIHLVDSNEAFYYKDFELDQSVYRIFNYRLASYTDFLEPNALECRGVMFEISPGFRLASLPMQKFFNLNENPLTMDLDLSDIDEITLKADGSLISTYINYDPSNRGRTYNYYNFYLKSKGSLFSDQAMDAMKFLALEQNAAFKEELVRSALSNLTINMEYVAPDNRIVIGYQEPQLVVLNIRNNFSGGYLDINEFFDPSTEIYKRQIAKELPDNPTKFVTNIPQMEDVEGYVVRLSNGMYIKVKTEWYLVQHRAKDSINSPRRLFEAVLEEVTDDLRSLFFDDPYVLDRIKEMELLVDKLYNGTVKSVEEFYETNKGLERKDYAILGQKELDRRIFGLVMSKYIGRLVDYKAFLKKNYKSFGIKDEEPPQE